MLHLTRELTLMIADYEEYSNIIRSINIFIESILEKHDIPICNFRDVSINELLKLVDIQIKYPSECYISKLLTYIEVANQILKPEIFVFANIMKVLDNEEILLLIESFKVKEYKFIFIEHNSKKNCTLEKLFDNTYTIDNDLCEL